MKKADGVDAPRRHQCVRVEVLITSERRRAFWKLSQSVWISPDAIDAATICEAVQRPGMHFVAVRPSAAGSAAGVPHP